MRKIIELKSLRIILVTQFLIVSLGVSQEAVISPCGQATYDAERLIRRSLDVLNNMFDTNEEIAEYLKCYYAKKGTENKYPLLPCEQATRDLENHISRPVEELKAMYTKESDLETYARCYYIHTGEKLEIGSENITWAIAGLVLLAVIIVATIIIPSSEIDFKGWDPA